MAMNDLLLHFDDSARGQVRLALAADLAKRCAAQLTALYVEFPTLSERPYEMPAAYAAFAGGAIEFTRAKSAGERGREATDSAEQRFRMGLEALGLSASWLVGEGAVANCVADQALYRDLTIVGQWDPAQTPVNDEDKVTEKVLIGSGRPVLIIPYAGRFAGVGRRVLIAWKKSREAARAVNDALPILEHAEAVTLLTVTNQNTHARADKESSVRVAEHLARNHVNVKIENAVSGVPAGDIVLNYVSDFGADLVVAGGFSHTRARERYFGGVTSTLLSQMTAPVLLSH